MDRQSVLRIIGEEKLIAIVRMRGGADLAARTAEALHEGGVRIIEITTSVPDAAKAVMSLASREGRDYLVGAGTVLSRRSAVEMVEAGAEFLVSPAVIEEVIAAAGELGVPVLPGALTPTEVYRASVLGADAVKIFPASLTGPGYLQALAGPLPGVRLVPTGGIDLDNIGSYLESGAFAVGVGGKLVDTAAIERGDWDRVSSNAADYVRAVSHGTRSEPGS